MSTGSVTQLQSLPPELFGAIFRFLDAYDIYQAFYGLSKRLSELVLTHGIEYFDLRERDLSTSKTILLEIGHAALNTLKLSNQPDEQFIEHVFDLHYFPLLNTESLRSLTLDYMSVFTMHSLLRRSFMLCELRFLTIRFQADQCREKLHDMYDHLLAVFPCHFPSLQSLDISADEEGCTDRSTAKILNSALYSTLECFSLRHLSIDNVVVINALNLLSRCRNLHSLCANVKLCHSLAEYPALPHLSVCQLVLIRSSFQSLADLLKQCSNLKRLMLNLIPVDDDGRTTDQWKHLIQTYLPKLKHLDISMRSFDIDRDDLERSFLCYFSLDHFWLDRRTKVTVEEKETTEDEDFPIEIMISFSIGKAPVAVQEENEVQ